MIKIEKCRSYGLGARYSWNAEPNEQLGKIG